MGAAEVTPLPHALHMKGIRQKPANCPVSEHSHITSRNHLTYKISRLHYRKVTHGVSALVTATLPPRCSWLSESAGELAQSAGLPTPATACFSVRLTTKRTTRRAGIAAAVPVFGLHPRARLARTCHIPKRRRITDSPCWNVCFSVVRIASTASSAWVVVYPISRQSAECCPLYACSTIPCQSQTPHVQGLP